MSRDHKRSAAFLIAFALTFAIGGKAMAVFALLIMLGSVQLGWHYAVDGYAVALIAWVAWRVGLTLAQRDGVFGLA